MHGVRDPEDVMYQQLDTESISSAFVNVDSKNLLWTKRNAPTTDKASKAALDAGNCYPLVLSNNKNEFLEVLSYY